MAGASTSSLRSAYVAEVTPGTIPATPSFKTVHSPLAMIAKPTIIQGRSLVASGGRLGQGYTGIDVTGSLPRRSQLCLLRTPFQQGRAVRQR